MLFYPSDQILSGWFKFFFKRSFSSNASVSSKHYPVLLLMYVNFTNIEIKSREKRGREKKGDICFKPVDRK